MRASRYGQIKKEVVLEDGTLARLCSTCKEYKNISNFSQSYAVKYDGRLYKVTSSYCKGCLRIISKRNYATKKGKDLK
jgi:hypothetical protein